MLDESAELRMEAASWSDYLDPIHHEKPKKRLLIKPEKEQKELLRKIFNQFDEDNVVFEISMLVYV